MPAGASGIQPLQDTTELVELFEPYGLYLKPIARLNITVQLPLLKEPGRTISNWDLMEKLKKIVKPHHFSTIKVAKSSLEFVRFEAEVDNRSILVSVVELLDDKAIKIIGFFESFKVKASEARVPFPTRHDWDSFFRDAKRMDEMKPGERPDTVHIDLLPCKWFAESKQSQPSSASGSSLGQPSEVMLKKVFETFGDIRCVDIPLIDPYRREMTQKLQTFNFNQELTFDCYVQFTEYISFVKAMDALRGMKLVHVDEEGKAMTATIKLGLRNSDRQESGASIGAERRAKPLNALEAIAIKTVDFDKTKHLSDKKIRQRRVERERLSALEKQREEKLRKEREEEEQRKVTEQKNKETKRIKEEESKFQRRREREEKRRLRHLEKRKQIEDEKLEKKIRTEERKIILAQRRLESMRLLSDVLMQIKLIKQKERVEEQLRELERVTEEEVVAREQIEIEEQERKTRMLRRREERLRSQVAEKMQISEARKYKIQRTTVPENVMVPRWKPYEKQMPGRKQRQGIWDRIWNLDDNLDDHRYRRHYK